MTYYYKRLNGNGQVIMIGTQSFPFMPDAKIGSEEITEEKYKELQTKIQSKPEDTLEQKYLLDDSTEEYKAFNTTHEEKVNWYVNAVVIGDMALSDVPSEFKAEVEAMMPTPEVNEENLNKSYKEGVQNA